jgi:hypothetical protein
MVCKIGDKWRRKEGFLIGLMLFSMLLFINNTSGYVFSGNTTLTNTILYAPNLDSNISIGAYGWVFHGGIIDTDFIYIKNLSSSNSLEVSHDEFITFNFTEPNQNYLSTKAPYYSFSDNFSKIINNGFANGLNSVAGFSVRSCDNLADIRVVRTGIPSRTLYNGLNWSCNNDTVFLEGLTGSTINLNHGNNYFYLDYNQSFVTLNKCANNTLFPVLAFGVYDEETKLPINNSEIKGNIDYWISGNQNLGNRTLYLDLKTSDIPLITGNEAYHAPSSAHTHISTIATDFRVLTTGIISAYKGISLSSDVTNVTIYKCQCGVCNSGDIIAQKTANTGYYANFTQGDYSEYLKVGTHYCLIAHTRFNYLARSAATTTYTGDILSINNQYMTGGATSSFIKAESIIENPATICSSNSTLGLEANSYLQYTGGIAGYTQRWYLFNQSLSSSNMTTINLYNHNDTTGTKTASTTLYKDQYVIYPNVITTLQRYYPAEDLWRDIQMDKTDDFGRSYWHIRETDTNYRIKFNQLLTSLGQTQTLKFKCPIYADCNFDLTISGSLPNYTSMFKDIQYSIKPDALSLTALSNISLQFLTSSANSKIHDFAIWTSYGGSNYLQNSTSASGGAIDINFTTMNVSDPVKLRVYYQINSLDGEDYSKYLDYWIYPHHSDPSFFKAMVYAGANINSAWKYIIIAFVIIGILGLIVSMGTGNPTVLVLITLGILGIFTFFGWFDSTIMLLLIIPSLIIAFTLRRFE